MSSTRLDDHISCGNLACMKVHKASSDSAGVKKKMPQFKCVCHAVLPECTAGTKAFSETQKRGRVINWPRRLTTAQWQIVLRRVLCHNSIVWFHSKSITAHFHRHVSVFPDSARSHHRWMSPSLVNLLHVATQIPSALLTAVLFLNDLENRNKIEIKTKKHLSETGKVEISHSWD